MAEQMIAASNTSPAGNGTRAFRVVLYRRDHEFHPYVVHYEAEEGDRWHGAYLASNGEAASEFERRCEQWGLRDEALKCVWDTERGWVEV